MSGFDPEDFDRKADLVRMRFKQQRGLFPIIETLVDLGELNKRHLRVVEAAGDVATPDLHVVPVEPEKRLWEAVDTSEGYADNVSLTAYAEIADVDPLSLRPRDRIALRWPED